MCGIAGYQGAFPDSLAPRMCAILAHRGPDHQAYWHDKDKAIGLVHTRLSIIDLSPRSNQPLWDSTGRYCIVFNGEIYNYRELRSDLVRQGCSFTSDGDGEVILNGFIRQGVSVFSQLNGIYALAIWDHSAGELVVARDQFGVKPLYFAQNEVGVLFASEIKALLCSPSVSRDLDPVALWQTLTFLWVPGPRTVLGSVEKMNPGSYVRVKGGRIVERRSYASYPAFEPTADITIQDGIHETRRLLEQAVQRQLVADVPVGAFLSGGVDSSAICYFAAKALGRSLQCFTVELQDAATEGMEQDLLYARLMAKRIGVSLEAVRVKPDLVRDLPRMLYALDEPQADPAPINALYIAERAREMNIKVLLSGAGGDDVFSGYRRHYALLQEYLWAWLPAAARSALQSATSMLPRHSPLTRRLAKAFNYAALSRADRIISYFYWIDPKRSIDLFSDAYREQLAGRDVGEPMRVALESGVAGTEPLNQMLYLEQRHFLVDHNFNYTDKTSMAAGVEVRVPFLDPDLVAFANRLPVTWKYHGRDGKWILKKALEGSLPESILHRRKAGFGAPLRAWLRGPLAPFVSEMLSPEVIHKRGIFRVDSIERLIADDQAGRQDAAYTIFSLICIELWARQFIDQPVPRVTA